jgi:outer membrane protein assembly factor BamB
VATTEGEAVWLRADSGEELFRTALPGPGHGDVMAAGERAFVATRDGHVVCMRPERGLIVWSRRVAEGTLASPAVSAGTVVAASDGGMVFALAADDGRTLWQRGGLGEILLRPEIAGDRVVVAGEHALHGFDLRTGERGPKYDSEQPWSSPPVHAHGHLIAGNQAGIVFVLDPATLQPRYLIRDKGKISAPVGIDPRGGIIAAFENKNLQGFRELP